MLSNLLKPLPSYTTNGRYGFRDGLAVENNAWNALCSYSLEVCPSLQGDTVNPFCGWNWDFDSANGRDVQAFPEVLTGRKPWSETTILGSKLPRPLGGLSKVEAEFEYRHEATGQFNVALESWLLKHVDSGPEEIVAEVMWWTEFTELARPAGRVIETFVDKYGQQWGLYHESAGVRRAWPYFAFCAVQPTYRKVDVLAGLQFISKVYQNLNDSILATVELGTEIWKGKGTFICDKFVINLT